MRRLCTLSRKSRQASYNVILNRNLSHLTLNFFGESPFTPNFFGHPQELPGQTHWGNPCYALAGFPMELTIPCWLDQILEKCMAFKNSKKQTREGVKDISLLYILQSLLCFPLSILWGSLRDHLLQIGNQWCLLVCKMTRSDLIEIFVCVKL